MIRSYCTTWTRFPNGSWKSRGPGSRLRSSTTSPNAPVPRRRREEERDELVAEVEKGTTVGALDRADVEATGVERDRGFDVVDLERDVVDADGTGELRAHAATGSGGRGRASQAQFV